MKAKILMVLLSLLPGVVLAKDEVPYTMNIKYISKKVVESIVYIDDNNKHFVPADDVNSIFDLSSKNLKTIKIDGIEYYSEEELGKFDIKDQYFILSVDLKNSLLPPQEFNLHSTKYSIEPSFIKSSYLNYNLSYDVNTNLYGTDFKYNKSFSKNSNFETFFSYSNVNDQGLLLRNLNYKYYNMDKNYDITLGTYVSPEGISNGFSKFGFSIKSNFSDEKDYSKQIRQSFKGTAELEGIADLYINGNKIRSEKLRPGDFTYSGITNPTVGPGEAKFVIRNKLGKVSEVSMPLLPTAKLNKPGTYDYSFDIGYLRPTENTLGRVVGSASGNYGLFDNLNINGSLDFSGKESLKNIGISTMLGGSLSLNYGLGIKGSGYGVNYATEVFNVPLNFSYNVKKDFVGLESSLIKNSKSFTFGTQFKVGKLPINIDYTKIDSESKFPFMGGYIENKSKDFVFDASTKFQLTNDIVFGIGYTHSNIDKRISATLTFNLDGTKVSNFYDSNTGKLNSDISFKQNKFNPDSSYILNYSAGSTYNSKYTDEKSFYGVVDVGTQYGSGNIIVNNSGSSTNTNLNFSGALGFVDNKIIPTTQIIDSFIYVDTNIPGLEISNYSGYMGKTNSDGKLIIPTASFLDNNIELNPLSTPEDYSVNNTEYKTNNYPNSASTVKIKGIKMEWWLILNYFLL